MKKLLAVPLGIIMLTLVGCSTSLDAYRDAEPHLKLEEFFNGDLVAYGMVQDYSGEVIQRFRVELEGSWEGNEGCLTKPFIMPTAASKSGSGI